MIMLIPINNIQLQFACSENWDKMDNLEQEKFCNSCSKKVYDFTNKSQAHFDAIVAENKQQKICGRFNNNQLKRNYVIAQSTSIAIVSSILFINHYYVQHRKLLGIMVLGKKHFSDTIYQSPIKDTIYNTQQNKISFKSIQVLPDNAMGTLNIEKTLQEYFKIIKRKTHKNYDGIYTIKLFINAKGHLINVQLLRGNKYGFRKMKPTLFKMQYEPQSVIGKYRNHIASIKI
jgi:hypothetical protein